MSTKECLCGKAKDMVGISKTIASKMQDTRNDLTTDEVSETHVRSSSDDEH